jgi:hypothetical protein
MTGCASVLPSETSTVRNVVHSDPIVQAQRPMAVKLKGAGMWITPDRLSVSVDEVTGCDDGYRDTVESTRIVTRKTKGLVAEVGLGLTVAGVGATGLLIAPQLSDQATGNDKSPREIAITWSAIGLAAGAVILGHAVYVAAKGADEVSDTETTIERRSAGRPLRSCGTGPAGPGKVIARVDGRSVELGTVNGGNGLVIEPRDVATRLCSEPDDAPKIATLRYVLNKNNELSVELAKYPLRQCVSATVARKKLAAAESALSNTKDTPTVIWAFQSLEEATAAVRILPVTDPDREDLMTTAARLNGIARNRAKLITATLVDDASQAIDTDVLTSVRSVSMAMRVARLADDAAARWKQIYGKFVSRARDRGIAGYAVTQELLADDAATRGCLFGKELCEPITRDEARQTLGSVAEAAATAVEKQTAELRAATGELAKQVNIKSVQRSDRALENARPVRNVCTHGDLISPMDAQCSLFMLADAGLSDELTAHATSVTEIRANLAEQERRRANERIARAWRAHFAECRRLVSAVQQLQSVASCDNGCEQVRARMIAERARLASFRLDEPVDDPKLGESLRDECANAGCEACPQE